MKQINLKYVYCLLLIAIPTVLQALTFEIPIDSDIIGETRYVISKDKETLFDIAIANDMGLFEILEANPSIKNEKIKAGTKVLIPSAFVLPTGPREVIVLNLAELRLYFYHPNSNLVSTYPVGIGRTGWKTPIGNTTITKKRANPTWTPPPGIRAHYEDKGIILPESIPPGPKNPLGKYALNLAWSGYLIHGTNQQNSVGLRSSSGCIRMYAADIQELFNLVEINTKVAFVHDPFKIGKVAKNLYLEAHQPLPEPYYDNHEDDELTISKEIERIANTQISAVHWDEIKQEMHQTFGYPIQIGVFQ